MRCFLVGGPQMALAYFREFGNAIAYWNYLTLGDGITELQNLGIDPEVVSMYELKFVEDEDPDLIRHVDESNARTRKRRVDVLQKSFDEVSDGASKEQGNDSPVLVKTSTDSGSNTSPHISRDLRYVERKVEHDARVDHRTPHKEHKTS